MEKVKEISCCRLCHSDKLEVILDLGLTPPANALVSKEDLDKPEDFFPLIVVQCECGCVQIKHTVHPDILFKNYLYESSTSASFRKHFEDYAKTLIEFCGLKQGDRVVDIGSNDNILLRPLKTLGIISIGVEPATNLVEKNKEDGIVVINNFFTPEIASIILDGFGTAKVITCNNCFAHIDDLHNVIRGVKILMDKDSYFVFEVAYLLDAYQKGLWDNQYHEHIFTHGVKSLKKLFQMHDLDLIHVERIPTHGGSIRCFVRKALAEFPTWSIVQDLIELEENAGLYNKMAWQHFRDKINQNRSIIVSTLYNLKSQGKTIAAFGAPAKTTTLLNFVNVGNNIIDFIVDDAVLKQGKYLPGKHIPIVTKEHLLKVNPDYCVLTAWNFAEIIKNNNSEYQGKWIDIIPEVKINI